jgi:predicted RecA/RadA family phage recombinase
MKNYVQKGDTLTLVAPYDVAAGQCALVGSLFGVALNDVKNTVSGEFRVKGVFDLAKVNAQAWTQGAAIYWSSSNKNCTTVSSGNTKIGVAVLAAANPSAVGRVYLPGKTG